MSATLSQVSRSRFVSGGGFIRERSKRRVELVARAEATYRNLARSTGTLASECSWTFSIVAQGGRRGVGGQAAGVLALHIQ